jgi:hypothetical protein
MTREELESKVRSMLEEFDFDHDAEGWAKDIVKVVYNKAIEDAIELQQEDYPHDGSSYSVGVEDLNKLKIG